MTASVVPPPKKSNKILGRLRKSIKGYVRHQWVDMGQVKPEARSLPHLISLNSEAGTIDFRIRNQKDLCRFRDHYLNRFHELIAKHKDGEKITRELFVLYDEIRRHFRVKYRANVRTRLRSHLPI